jgi:uncharacterized NAD-dependent epimerase/dehydratase family protein
MVLMTEGLMDPWRAKTAASLLRYRRDEVVAVLDSTAVGRDVAAALGAGAGLEVVPSVAAAMKYRPDTLVVGIAPSGGRLPPAMRTHVIDALRAGWTVYSGLHTFLCDDPQLAALAAEHGAALFDARKVPVDLPCGTMRAAGMAVRRVLTVGTDCNSGKMCTSIELDAAARRRGWKSLFVPTGQTGIFIAGWGMALDRVISDFVAGAAEQLLARAADRQICFIEGQGALTHAAYSGVTLSLMHGFLPDAMVLCHVAGRPAHNSCPTPLPTLADARDLYEHAMRHVRPCKVVGAALNTLGLDDAAARKAVDAAAEELDLPATDAIRFGADPLMPALEALLR